MFPFNTAIGDPKWNTNSVTSTFILIPDSSVFHASRVSCLKWIGNYLLSVFTVFSRLTCFFVRSCRLRYTFFPRFLHPVVITCLFTKVFCSIAIFNCLYSVSLLEFVFWIEIFDMCVGCHVSSLIWFSTTFTIFCFSAKDLFRNLVSLVIVTILKCIICNIFNCKIIYSSHNSFQCFSGVSLGFFNPKTLSPWLQKLFFVGVYCSW